MGQSASQSVRERRYPQKLSKPRIGDRPTTAGLLSRDGFSSVSGRFSAGQLSDELLAHLPDPSASPSLLSHTTPDTASTLERRSSVISFGPKLARRRNLFRSKSVYAKSSKKTIDMAPSHGNPIRSNTLAYEPALLDHDEVEEEPSWPFRSGTTPWTYDLGSYEAKRMLHLVEESGTEHETAVSEHKISATSESTWDNSHQPLPASTPMTRTNSEVADYTSVRRRSVTMTPGVATRTSSFRVFPPCTRPSFRLSHPATPRRASVESFRSGVMSMSPSPSPREAEFVPRVETPSEDGYHVIGAFKLGSLRITNGAASPVSINAERGPSPGNVPQADGGDGLRAQDDDFFAPQHRNVNGLMDGESNKKDADDVDDALEMAAPHRRVIADFPRSVTASLPSASANGGVSHGPRPQFLAEISVSPLALTIPDPLDGGLEITSKHTALEDKLFEEEGLFDCAAEESRLEGHALSTERASRDRFHRTDSGFVSSTSPSCETRPVSMFEADSAYSSNVSLRSLRTKEAAPESTPEVEAHLRSLGHATSVVLRSGNASSSSTTGHACESEREPPKDGQNSMASANGMRSTASRGDGGRSETTLPRVPRAKLTPSTLTLSTPSETAPRSPDSMPKTPLSATSSSSGGSSSALSIGSVSRRRSKLQRFLSGAKRVASGPLTAHTTHVSEQNGIPAVPAEAETKLREHSGLFPMTTKRLALRPRASRDTLRTILSLGSLEANLESAHMPVTLEHDTIGPGAADQATNREPPLVFNTALDAITFKIPRKPVTNISSLDGTQEVDMSTATDTETMAPAEAEITSLAYIRNSLGHNAYDAAFVALEGSRLAKQPRMSGGRRTMSLTRSVEGRFKEATAHSRLSSSRPPPPVSMGNQKARLHRAPPPVRTRHTDGETFQSPAVRHTTVSDDLSIPAPPIPPMSSHRAASARRLQVSRHSQVMGSWDVQSDLGWQNRWARTSLDGEHGGKSLSTGYAHPMHSASKPGSGQPRQGKSGTPPCPPLRHRASFDGFGHGGRRPRDQYVRPPVPHFNTWSNGNELSAGYRDRDGRRAGPPRTHHRSCTMGSRDWNGHHIPYRVLHSYNSPAYRNVPIWG